MKSVSDHFDGRIFLNPVHTEVMDKGAFLRVLRQYFKKHPNRYPKQRLGPFKINRALLNELPKAGLRITWLGHSTTLLEIEGARLLIDPVWYNRASPFRWMGPRRFFQNPLSIRELPSIDCILLSHDHYDHLDKQTLLQLAAQQIPIITLLGVGERLIKWGADKTRITELDWWQSHFLNDTITITALPARHFSGRWLNDRFSTLWGSFAITGKKYNVYYGADSGYYDGFTAIGEKYGPFDLTLMEIGAYDKEWSSIHMGPEAAVKAHLDVKGKLLMPLHWGTFSLAFHPWTEPVERLITAAKTENVSLLLPAPGETRSIKDGAYNSEWWKQYA